MLDCNNNTQIFEDNHGIFEDNGNYKYSLSNDEYNRLVYELETNDNREILEIISAKFKYLYEKIIKNLNISSDVLSIPITYMNNINHIIETISIYHSRKDYNIFQLLDDYDMTSVGMIYTFIDYKNINFHNLKIKSSSNEDVIKSNLSFNKYIQLFIKNYDPSNIDKINKALFLLNKPETKRKTRKTKSIIKKGGNSLPIITEQSFVSNETIYYYFQNKDNIQLFPPTILEYDDENKQLIVVDGNNRLAFYIIDNIMNRKNDKIPVIIAIKDINKKFNDLI
jgi:hypothetical protein